MTRLKLITASNINVLLKEANLLNVKKSLIVLIITASEKVHLIYEEEYN